MWMNKNYIYNDSSLNSNIYGVFNTFSDRIWMRSCGSYSGVISDDFLFLISCLIITSKLICSYKIQQTRKRSVLV